MRANLYHSRIFSPAADFREAVPFGLWAVIRKGSLRLRCSCDAWLRLADHKFARGVTKTGGARTNTCGCGVRVISCHQTARAPADRRGQRDAYAALGSALFAQETPVAWHWQLSPLSVTKTAGFRKIRPRALPAWLRQKAAAEREFDGNILGFPRRNGSATEIHALELWTSLLPILENE